MTDEPKEQQTIEVQGKVVFDRAGWGLAVYLKDEWGYSIDPEMDKRKQYRVIVVEVE